VFLAKKTITIQKGTNKHNINDLGGAS